MTSREIRQSFLDFFHAKKHRIVPSAPVIPQGDPTLLFTNAGMNQFKDVFLGTGTRDYSRAADTQKCIRVSGKHNDLEEVGHDTYHHTFFEMLGNWSFADYGKKEAIQWAWELLTGVWGLPKDRLYATVFRTDDEAHMLWSTVTDIDPSHIIRFNEKDNFWEMGETGPCGPCSEIHIDLTDDKSGGALVNAGSPKVIEIWNLVFIQNNRNAMGELEDLGALHVDTGMGFERVCAVMQGKKSNYDSDVFTPLLDRIGELAGKRYADFPHDGIEQISMRVMSDHIRTLSFAIADGATPSNEDRGYVLRRILRRASRYARNLGLNEPVLYKLVATLVAQMGDIFPEIKEKQSHIERVVKAEEESFNVTLDRGIDLFNDIAKRAGGSESPIVTGEEMFKLYDTFGFPVDLTVLMAKEREMSVDMEGFERLMDKQKKQSRKKTGAKGLPVGLYSLDSDKPTAFVGYTQLSTTAHITAAGGKLASAEQGIEKLGVVIDRTPFYVEAGGQVSDKGVITVNIPGKGTRELKIDDVLRDGSSVLHVIDSDVAEALRAEAAAANASSVQDYILELLRGKELTAAVDAERRRHIMRNHTATHLVHEALRRIVGTHLHQQGSLVAPDRMRFDFNHFEKIPDVQLRDIEQLVNSKIREGVPVITRVNTPIEEAKKIPNVKMFFGDKYGDLVNVVIADESYSVEFCGGTHVQNTADIGYFKLIAEAGIASGMRRIEAVTGFGADEILHHRYQEVERLSRTLNVSDRELYRRVEELLEEKKKLEKELAKLKLQSASSTLDTLIAEATMIGDARVVAARVDAGTIEEMRPLGEALLGKLTSGIGVLASIADGKIQLVCVVTADLSKKCPAGKLVGEVAKMLGGSGGGRPTLATGGGKDVNALPAALQAVPVIAQRMLA